MLVLSRKKDQKILFPNLGIAVQVLRIDGHTVRVGIEAPDDVPVLREEIARDFSPPVTRSSSPTQRHALRNRLNTAALALHLLQKQLDAGKMEGAERSLQDALDEFSKIDQLLAGRAAEDHGSAQSRSGTGRKALLVEDNPHERELLAAYLRANGYEVATAQDGLDAMRYLSVNEQPHVVLLDMQMPRLNGRKTVSAIRRNPAFRGMKLIAVSGAGRREVEMPLGPRGVDRWFSKPLDPARFVEELDRELSEQHPSGRLAASS